MARFNALTSKLENPAEPAPPKRSRKKAAPAPLALAKPETELSRHVCRIPSATIAALLGDPEMTTAAAATHRTAFADWCAVRPHLKNWRPAWKLFEAALALGTAEALAVAGMGLSEDAPRATAKLPDGAAVTFTPTDRRNTPTTGTLVETIRNTSGAEGYHILAPLQGDPGRIVRVWAADGKIEVSEDDAEAAAELAARQREDRQEQAAEIAAVRSKIIPFAQPSPARDYLASLRKPRR